MTWFAPEPRHPDYQYTVTACELCRHPGGQHIAGAGCRLCPACPGFTPGGPRTWTDRMTDEGLARMAAGETEDGPCPA